MKRWLLSLSLLLMGSPAWGQTYATLPTIADISCGTSSGSTIVATNTAEFAAALTTAAALDEAGGTTITLTAGTTFAGPFTLPVKTGTGCITIRTDAADGALPGATTRIDPSYASVLPKIIGTDANAPAIQTAAGAHHYKLLGLEIIQKSETTIDTIMTLGDGSSAQNLLSEVPHHLEVDRVYVHAFSTTSLVKRGIGLNSASTTIKNSYISEIKHTGADNQAIGGWNGPGPYIIHNNYLEASCENMMLGGADTAITNQTPSDIQITNNHFFKPLKWRVGDVAYGGVAYSVKNLLELKHAQRVLIEGNTFENSWVSGQPGYALTLTVRNQSGGNNWAVVQDITAKNNWFKNVANIANIPPSDSDNISAYTTRISILNNLATGLGWSDNSTARGLGAGSGNGVHNPSLGVAPHLVFEHNTFLGVNTGGAILAPSGSPGALSVGFYWRNNIHYHNTYGVQGESIGVGTATLNKYWTGYTYLKNVMITNPYPASYPANNFDAANLAAVGFTDAAGGDYSLTVGSPYHNAATDGTDVGVDWTALQAALADTEPPPPTPTVPDTPTGLRVVSLPSPMTSLIWAPTSGASVTGYRIYRSTTSGSSTPRLAQVTPASSVTTKMPLTTYHDVPPRAGTYYYTITSIAEETNESLASAEVSVTVTCAGSRQRCSGP